MATGSPFDPDHDSDPDEHLRAALRHAPDATLQAPERIGAALRASARSVHAPAPWWRRVWSGSGQPRLLGASGAFATLLIGGVVVLLWRGEVPAPASEAEVPKVVAAPVAAPTAAATPPTTTAPAPVATPSIARERSAARTPAETPQQPSKPMAAPAAPQPAPAPAPAESARVRNEAAPTAASAEADGRAAAPAAPAPAAPAARAADSLSLGAAKALSRAAVDPWSQQLQALGVENWPTTERPSVPPTASSPQSTIWLDDGERVVIVCRAALPVAPACRRAVLSPAQWDSLRASLPERR